MGETTEARELKIVLCQSLCTYLSLWMTTSKAKRRDDRGGKAELRGWRRGVGMGRGRENRD